MRINFDKRQILSAHFLLKHLSRERLDQLAEVTYLDNFPRGGMIFQKGDPGDSMMAVVRGKVKIGVHSIDGKEIVFNIVNQGNVFGEISLLDGEPRSADASALEDTDILILDRSKFLPLLERQELLNLITVLCKRLRQTSENLEDTHFLDAPARLARALLRLGETFGKQVGTGARIDIKLSQSQLGNIVGLSRETVNKHLGEWEEAGHISREGGVITLLDRDEIEEISVTPSGGKLPEL
jgi:CRP/FNR family cyclic AMP-dependent transcriptional regulator